MQFVTLFTLLVASWGWSPVHPAPRSCVYIYDIWTKQHINFRVLTTDNSGVLVHRIVKNKELNKVETYDWSEFYIWQPIFCERILK